MIVDQGLPHVLVVSHEEGSVPVEPLVLRGEIRNYPVRVGEVAHVWATESHMSRGISESSIDFRVVRVEDVQSDGVVVSVCRYPCIGDACPCMQVVLEPFEVLIPVSWLFWFPLTWCVMSFIHCELCLYCFCSFASFWTFVMVRIFHRMRR